MSQNPYLLAADNPQALVTLLQENPSLASGQDEHGYSLVHAATSYSHLDLIRSLVRDFNVPVDLRDEDGETALFVAESVDAARILVEELGLNAGLKNDEGVTAREKIEAEGEWPELAQYLSGVGAESAKPNGSTNGDSSSGMELPPAPDGLKITVGTMNEAETGEQQPDPEFRRRIEELAARTDLETPEGQADLRRLVEDAITREGLSEERSVRTRQE